MDTINFIIYGKTDANKLVTQLTHFGVSNEDVQDARLPPIL